MLRKSLLVVLAVSLPSLPAFADGYDDEAASSKPKPHTDPQNGPSATNSGCTPEERNRPSWSPIPTCDERVLWGIALQGHGLFVPGFLLAPFLQEYGTLNSGGFAVQGIRRKGTLDIVMTLDFSLYTPADGNWLGSGKDPTLDTHYVQFHGLNFMSFDVAFLYTHDLASWIAIQIGGGVGLGYVFGEIDAINASVGCSASTAGDPTMCYPHSDTVTYTNAQGQIVPVGDIKTTDPDFQSKLNATQTAQNACLAAMAQNPSLDCRDTAQHPFFHATTDKPPVLPVINFILGFKLKLHRHFNFNISGGFRNGFVVNGGPEYVF